MNQELVLDNEVPRRPCGRTNDPGYGNLTRAVIAYTPGRVLKTHVSQVMCYENPDLSIKGLKRERKVYEALGDPPSILK